MTTLKELWYGNIIPWEKFVKDNEELRSLLHVLSNKHDKLTVHLTESQNEMLEQYNDTVDKMHTLTQEAAFQYGFSLGVRLVMESILTPL